MLHMHASLNDVPTNDICDGKFNVLFSTPESWLSKRVEKYCLVLLIKIWFVSLLMKFILSPGAKARLNTFSWSLFSHKRNQITVFTFSSSYFKCHRLWFNWPCTVSL